MAVDPGTFFGPYQIEAPLGAGGMGIVYRAYDPRLKRRLAIKVLAPLVADNQARARLIHEARSASALNHPHICTVYDVGEEAGQAFIAMEYLDGRSLYDVARQEQLAFEDVLRYGWQVADALTHAHEHGVVHRDLKAANVIVTSSGRLKVLDFGLAIRVGEADGATGSNALSAQDGAVAGTIYAMAPEQLRGEPIDSRTDVWALGVLLYEMAVGRPPFSGQSVFDLTSAILRDRPTPPPLDLARRFGTSPTDACRSPPHSGIRAPLRCGLRSRF